MLSEHFSLTEMIRSTTATARGISNVPDARQILALKNLCINVLEPLRKFAGRPILIGSGYRCWALNKAVGGAATSQHMKGEAADIYLNGDYQKGKEWFGYIRKNLKFDQLIWEHNARGTYWIHVSFREGNNRGQVINNLLKK